MRVSVNSFGIAAACVFGAFLTVHVVFAASPVTPNDPLYSKQWYLHQIHAPEAWAVSTGSRAVVVALIDAGVDFEHPDLAGKEVDGWNFIRHSSDTTPLIGRDQTDEALSHGTIVASLLAASGNDGFGMAGVAWNVRIMPLVALGAEGMGSVENISEAIRFATAHGADIINVSLVGYENDQKIDSAILEAVSKGILVVAAAGNDDSGPGGRDLDAQPMYPACTLAGTGAVLTVSATDALDQKALYANYGHDCVSISAPGYDMLAAHPFHGEARDASSTAFVSGLTGTSAAAPLVSGAAALIKSARPDWKAAEIRARLLATADPIDAVQRSEVRGKMGSGRLNVGRALQGLSPAPRDTLHAPSKEAILQLFGRLIGSFAAAFTNPSP